MQNKKIALLIANTVSCYHTLKSLNKSGFTVDIIHYENNPIQHSKYINKYFTVFSPFIDANKCAQEVDEILDKHRYDAVLPINDSAIEIAKLLLHQHPEIIGINGKFADTFRSKITIWENSKPLGIPLIKGFKISTIDEYELLRNTISLPVVLKPSYSVKIINNRIHKFGVRVAKTIEDVDDYVYENCHNTEILIQETITGNGVGYNFFAVDGEVISSYSHLRLTEKDGGGVSSYRKTIPNDMFELDSISKKIIKLMRWTGIGMLEYRVKDNEAYVIELNGRPWGSMALGIFSGVNPVIDFVRWKTTGTFPQKKYTLESIYVRKLKEDFKEAVRSRNSATILKWVVGLWKVVRKNEYVEDIGIDDLPFKWRSLLPQYENKVETSVTNAPNFSVLSQLHRTKKICFVCHGNINRSAVAEYVLRDIYPNLNICSAGIINHSNRGASRNAIFYGKTVNIDMSGHRSKWVGEVEQENTIFVALDRKVYSQLTQIIADKKSIVMFDHKDVEDPYKTNQLIFDQVFKRITQKLNSLDIE